MLMAVSANAQDDVVRFGKVTTKRDTVLKTEPVDSSIGATTFPPNTELRWIMGQQKGNYVRVMAPRGATGWVLESDVEKVTGVDLSKIEPQSVTPPCVNPRTLDACTTTKPAGCSDPDSPHGLANELKRAIPTAGAAKIVNFKAFSELQTDAVGLVDQGVDISPDDRKKIKSIETSQGVLGEGLRVRLLAFLSEGNPHANTGESVNCYLKDEPNNDIHISVTESKDMSEFEGIVVEMIPQNRPEKWTSDNVATLRGKLLLIEGALFYDNLHVVNSDAANPIPRQPKRFSLWEIHPIVSVKVCKNADTKCDPNDSSVWEDF